MRQSFPLHCCLLLAFTAITCSAQSSRGGADSIRTTAADGLRTTRADTGAPRPGWRRLSPVVISAGEFSINDTRRTVLKPMDIMTTAGANADVIQVLQTLPGTQQAGANTGLFVRGGDASESLVIIDGLVVQNPFFSALPGVSQSSRFSPFQFKGLSFSSGGYSARYGQALSSILELNTRDLAESSKMSIGLNATGIFASGALLRKNSSFEASGYYNNFSPFYHWANSNLRFYHSPSGPGLSLKYTLVSSANQLLKIFVRGAGYRTGLVTPDPFRPGDSTRFDLDNRLWYAAATYKRSLQHKWDLSLAAAYSNNRDDIAWRDSTPIPLVNKDYRLQLHAEARKYFSSGCELVSGVDFQRYGYTRRFDTLKGSFAETLTAAFAELSWRPFPWLAFRPGLRYEYSALTRGSALSPRLSLALRSGQYAQFALAAGLFYQDPAGLYLLSGYRPSMQQALNLVGNWLWNHNGRTLRAEAYYKDYRQLVRERAATYDPDAAWRIVPAGEKVDNSGYGYAKGMELFWHDKETIKGFDYWLSYSYIDTKRLFSNYPKEATPDYVARHNLSVVTKYFVDRWQTNFSLTASYASGRPYYDPASPTFLGSHTPPFEDLSLAVGRLATIRKWFTVVYAGVGNITNHHNLFGYRYSYDGTQKYPILPAFYRSIIIGMNISLSHFDKSEL